MKKPEPVALSKSDYVLGLKCPLALWYKKYRKDLEPEKPTAVLERGNDVGALARERFPKGVIIDEKPWESQTAEHTKSCVKKHAKYIYEAVVWLKDGEYCAADILKRNADGTYDIVEVKSTSSVHEYHLIDVSFQNYVFKKAGYKIRKCHIMTLNSEYVRKGELDLKKLFKLHDVTDELTPLKEVEKNIAALRAMLGRKEPKCSIGVQCTKFHDCNYMFHCWRDIPEYSVFDILTTPKAEVIYNKHKTADIGKLAKFLFPTGAKKVDLESFLGKKTVSDPAKLREFLSALKYPLYFLDYETIAPAVPMFDNSRPYQAIPFQFSLHIQEKPSGKLKHVEYLHRDRKDPRPKLIKALVDACGKKGSVVVYNAGFETGRNREMALDFPKYAKALLAINDRVVDLLVPFRSRHLYCYKQHGSASIKKVLPTFTEISYDSLDIGNGGVASDMFLAFMEGKLPETERDKMFADLLTYCDQDTIAMVELLRVVEEWA
jgi:hypothetical protein